MKAAFADDGLCLGDWLNTYRDATIVGILLPLVQGEKLQHDPYTPNGKRIKSAPVAGLPCERRSGVNRKWGSDQCGWSRIPGYRPACRRCGLNPRVRSNGKWLPIGWQRIAVDKQHDVAVLKTNTVLDSQRIPVQYGEPAGMVYGGIGYVLGYPTWVEKGRINTEHVTEAGGRPIPIASLVVANFAASGESVYSASYINAGFSGGAVVFPLANEDWTIAGIVSHFPTVQRPVYRRGVETGDYVLEHTGLVGYTSLPLILDL